MSAVNYVNAQAEVLKKAMALAMNINAAKGLQEVMQSNLGPKGTLKMLVGGAGQVKLTKDGCVLLKEMQIRHPTAAMIARSATAQDSQTGDGTTSNILVIGALLKEAERLIQDGIHPRIISEGFGKAKIEACNFLESFKTPVSEVKIDKALLRHVARTSLATKLQPKYANMLVDIVTDAVLCIKNDDPHGEQIDLHMVEIMHMIHKMATGTKFINGLVLDHGRRNTDMPSQLKNCYILTLNVNLEDEKTEVSGGFFFASAEERERLMGAERAFVDKRLTKLIALKKKVCDGTDKTFVVINQKGIDPICLAALAKEGVFAVRRAKRRNMERLVLACGGHALNSLEDVTVDDLGWADAVWEEELGEDHYTFIEGCKNPKSCTILIKGPADYTIAILKDAIRDGLRAVKNVFDDQGVLAGAGAFEVACHNHLLKWCDENIKGKERLGVEAFAKALLVIPQTLAMNSGFDRQDCIIKMCETERANVRKALEKGSKGQKVSGEAPNKEEQGKKDEGWEKDNYSHKMNDGNQSINQFTGSGSIPRYTAEPVGLDLVTGDPMNPMALSIWDNYCVKKQFLNLTSILAEQLLLVDEVIKAGREMKKSF